MGTSAFGRSSPLCGVKTRAIPLLFERKKACYFSKTLVYVKVFPVTEENFWVCSCSSLRMGCARRLESLNPEVLDFTEAANLICLLPLLRPLVFSSCWFDSASAFSRYCYCSKASWISDFCWGASWEVGSKILAEKSNIVLIPERFLRTNFCERDLLILQLEKLIIFSLFMPP